MAERRKLSSKNLLHFTTELFQLVGLEKNQAIVIATHLVEANLRGVESHGLSRIPIYIKRMKEGYVDVKGRIEITHETLVSAVINGNNSPGILVAEQAIEWTVEKAKASGIAMVGINHSNHCGMLASYAKYAVEQDCIAILTSNASPSMAPWGGREPFFGTNPLCYGIPAGEEKDIILDMATSVVAKGKIRIAEKSNQIIPNDWAITKDGKRTTDPTEALNGMVLPVGGPKGYGLVLLNDILSGILPGANYGPYVSSMFENKIQGVGHFFMVFRPDLFQPIGDFKKRVDQMIREVRQVQTMEGVERIYLPGEMEEEKKIRSLAEGIQLSESFIEELSQLGRELGAKSQLEVVHN